MTDLQLLFREQGDAFACDLALQGARLATDEGLKTAVVVSLFTDRRARPDDPLPHGSADRRGWWGDSAASLDGDRIGSRLWLLSREKQLPEVLARAEEYAREALQWLVEDGVARRVEVEATAPRHGVLALAVVIERPAATDRFAFDYVWRAP